MTISPDLDLLARARAGDQSAISELYTAHVDRARHFARSICDTPADADDLVSHAFTRVLDLLRRGEGPTGNFGAYLFTSIRNAHVDLMRRRRDTPVSDKPWMLDVPVESVDAIDHHFDDEVAAAALQSLPSPWQRVLWHVEVEGRSAAEVAELEGMRPAAVSALAYRAREGLKLAYLDQYRTAAPLARDCEWTRPRLAKLVRDQLSPRAATKANAHLDECTACVVVVEQMREKNQRLSALFVPAVIVGGAATFGGGALSSTSSKVDRPDGTPPSPPSPAPRVPRAPRSGRLLSRGGIAAAVAVVVVIAAIGAWAVTSGGPADEPASAAPQASATDPEAPDDTDDTDVVEPLTPAVPETATDAPLVVTPVVARVTPPQSQPVQVVTPGAAGPVTTSPQVVTPVAPTATPVGACGTYGSVAMPDTTGVTYALSEGDGLSGPWTVTASPAAGYQLDPAAPTSFSGDLGAYSACPTIASAARTANGNGGWVVTTDVAASGPSTNQVSLDLRFDVTVFVSTSSGSGWTCWATDGASRQELTGQGQFQLQPGSQWVTCEHTLAGTDPAPVAVTVDLATADPTGTASVSHEGSVKDSATF